MTKRTRLIEKLIDQYQLKQVSPSSTDYGWLHGVCENSHAAKTSLAVCDLEQESYQFMEMPHPQFSHLLTSPISIRQFRQLICKDDHDHFDRSLQFALDFIAKYHPIDVGRYLLTFECRLTDSNLHHHNMQLKYWLMGTHAPAQLPALTLHMMDINRSKGSICPSRTGYIVDMYNKIIVKSFGKQRVSNKDVEVYKKLENWKFIKKASKSLKIKYETLKKRRRAFLQKTEIESDIKQTAIMIFTGVK